MDAYIEKIKQLRDKLIYMGYWDKIESHLETIMTVLLVGVIVFAVLNCFWGYQMMRLWMSIIGLAIGGLAGGLAGLKTFDSKNAVFITATVCGLLVAMVANLIYRVGLVVLCAGIVFLTFELLFPVASMGVHMGFVALGIVAGIMAFEYEDIVVTWVTGICGGLASVRTLLILIGWDNVFAAIVVGAIVAALGIRFQYGRLRKDPDVEKRQKKMREKRGE